MLENLKVPNNESLTAEERPLDMTVALEIVEHYNQAKENDLGLDSLINKVKTVLDDPKFVNPTAREMLQNILDGKDPTDLRI